MPHLIESQVWTVPWREEIGDMCTISVSLIVRECFDAAVVRKWRSVYTLKSIVLAAVIQIYMPALYEPAIAYQEAGSL